ncbi:MAG: hypothetical protein QF402_00990, partial [Candidatus Latescibacteria bacterium]|nr:hypothetical protein [Candidatus Latescibacterota bacterium]
MTPSSQDPTTDAGAPEPGRRRRRRRTDDAKNAPPAKRGETPNGRSRGSSGGGGLIPASWGLTPTFRVLLFLGAIVAVMSFLLYNEYLIREVSEQERFRAELYANLYGLAVSEALPPEYSALIADRILINPTIDLPLIVTNYRGEIILEKGTGLLAGDEHPETRRKLEELMDRMDAVNEPVKAHWTTQARGRVYIDGTHVIVTDPTHYPVAWAGEDLPALVEEGDPAPIQVVNTLQEMMEAGVQPKDFTAQASNTCYLAQSGDEFIIIEMGNASPLVWGGDQLPAPTDTTAYSLVRSSYDALAAEHAPVAFQLRTEHFIHFGDTELFNRISLAPVVTLGVLCLFGLIGYVGFRNMRRSEQRSIWVGMAKETAHQLGTPLSSLSGWLELMQQRLEDLQQRGDKSEAEAVASIATEMQRDMGRLNQIASRFSQIGSVPELQSGDLGEVVTDSLNYFRGRGSQFGRHTFEADVPPLPKIPLNAELMGWVFENLFKNAI